MASKLVYNQFKEPDKLNKELTLRRTEKIFLAVVCLAFGLISCTLAFGQGIAIYGDSQNNPDVQQKLVERIAAFKPEIIFRVGDLVDDGNDPSQWKAFRKIHGELLAGARYFPALGNHENDSPLYFEQFPFLHNQRWYAVEYQGVHFVILDSNSKLIPGSVQYKWLKADLARLDPTVQFVIVIFHHPLFDVSAHHQSDERKLKNALLPLFKHYGVSAVFSGHSHDYQRFEYEGMYFIVTGGGGSNLYPQARTNPYLQKFSLTYHFCLLSLESGFLRVKVFDVNSALIDEFKISARESSSNSRF